MIGSTPRAASGGDGGEANCTGADHYREVAGADGRAAHVEPHDETAVDGEKPAGDEAGALTAGNTSIGPRSRSGFPSPPSGIIAFSCWPRDCAASGPKKSRILSAPGVPTPGAKAFAVMLSAARALAMDRVHAWTAPLVAASPITPRSVVGSKARAGAVFWERSNFRYLVMAIEPNSSALQGNPGEPAPPHNGGYRRCTTCPRCNRTASRVVTGCLLCERCMTVGPTP